MAKTLEYAAEVGEEVREEPADTKLGRPVNRRRLPRLLEVLFVVTMVLQLVAPFTTHSYGTDGPSQVYFIDSFWRLIAQGAIVPRWLPNGFSGFGSPTFYFYPPMAGYLAAAVHYVTGTVNPYNLYQATGLLATMLSFGTAWLLLRNYSASKYQQWFGAAFYSFAPFRLAELYQRSSLSAHVGYIFLPLIALGVARIYEQHGGKARVRAVLLTGIAAAGIFLSNVPLALLTGVSLIVVVGVNWRKLNRAIAINLVAAGMLALLIGSYQIASIMEYSKFVQLEHLFRDPDFVILDVIHRRNLIALYYDVGIYTIMMAAGCVWWLGVRESWTGMSVERNVLRAGLAVSVMILVLQLPMTLLLWRHIKILQLIQGTWRFYIVVVLFGAAMVAVARSRRSWQASQAILWVSSVMVLLPAYLIVTNHHVGQHSIVAPTDPQEYVPLIGPPTGQALHDMIVAHERDTYIAPMGGGLDGEVKLIETRYNAQNYRVNLRQNTRVAFHRFDWPAWRAHIGARELAFQHDSVGRAVLDLPSGEYRLSISLTQSNSERAGLWITWLSIIAAIIVGIYSNQSKAVRWKRN